MTSGTQKAPVGAKIKLYLGMPSTGVCADLQPYALRELHAKYGDRIEFIYPDRLAHRIFHDAARNGIVEDFLTTDADILWFLDSDVVPPTHILDLITEHGDKWDVAGAPYPIFMEANKGDGRTVVFTAYKKINGGLRPSDIPLEGTDYLDGLATGCLFIKRDIFSKLTKPYFAFEYDEETRAPKVGEDLGFCLKLGKMGYQFFTDYSMVCKHYKNVELLEVSDYARLYAKNAVNAFHRVTEGQIKALDALFREKMKPTSQPPTSKLILPTGLVSSSSEYNRT